jgi:phage-related protein
MASVEERVVKMTFDNKAFEANVSETISSIDKLNKALAFKDGTKGLDELSKAGGKVDLGGIASNVEKISSKFTALGAVGFTVISTLTKGALGMAKKLGGDILGPIISGGTQRAKNIEQAKFMFEGLGINVQQGMDSALKAVKGTAYGLDDAAKAAAQFGASGIKVGSEMTGALRGVAGTAAMTGSSFSEMAQIFAGSAGSNKVTNQDFLQFATRGLNAAAAFGKVMGKTEAQVHEMAKDGDIDFKTFAAAMDKSFGAHATEANKTFSGALANMHAAMSRLGAAFISPELTQFRDLFNGISPVIDKITTALGPLMTAVNKMSQQLISGIIKTLGGLNFTNFTKAVPIVSAGLNNIWKFLVKIFDIGKLAFRDIFPKTATSTILNIANAFKKFTDHLTMSTGTIAKVRSIFDGLFSILKIGWDIIKGVVSVVASLVGGLLGLSGGPILNGLAKIGEFFTDLQKGTLSSGNIKKFFDEISKVLGEIGSAIRGVITDIVNFFKGPAFDKITPLFGRIVDRITGIKNAFGSGASGASGATSGFLKSFEDILGKIGNVLGKIWDVLSSWFSSLGKNIASILKNGQFSEVFDAINTALLGGIALLIAKWMKGGFTVDLTGGLADKIGGIFDELTNTLQAMQTKIKAEALMKIAEAIGILTASVVVLSLIDSAALTKALTAMAVGFGELMGSFAAITKLASGPKGAIQFDLIAGGMIVLSTAVLILAGAVKILSGMSWEELGRGLSAVIILMGLIVGIAKLLEGKTAGLIAAGTGITAMAIALTILGGAVKIFAQMSLAELGVGLAAVATALALIGAAMRLMPKGPAMFLQGAALFAIALSMQMLAKTMKTFAGMSWGEIGKGLVGVGGALAAIALALNLMPKDMVLTAAGLLLVSIALGGIAKAVKSMGGMSWGEIGKGLATMAGALILLAAAMYVMQGTILGAVAITVAAAALVILAGVIKTMSGISWGDILHGLGGIAIVLAALAIAALLIEPAVPAILALGVALLVVGAGFALFGLGAMMAANAFVAIANAGEKGAKSFVKALEIMAGAIPKFATALAKGVITFIVTIMTFIPTLIKLLVLALGKLLDGLTTLIPKIGTLVGTLITTIIDLIKTKYPELITAGLEMIVSILKGIRDNIPQIVTVVGEIITGFLDALATQLAQIVDSVANLIITLFTAVATAVGKVAGTLMFGIGVAFIQGFLDGVIGSQSGPAAWFAGLAARVIGWIGNVVGTLKQKGIDFITGLYNGLTSSIGRVSSWFSGLAGNVLRWIGNLVGTLKGKGSDLISGLYNGFTGAIGKVTSWFGGLSGKILSAVGNTLGTLGAAGRNIMTGLYNGITGGWSTVSGWIAGIGGRAASAVGNLGGVLTGAGRAIMDGLLSGITDAWNKVAGTLSGLASKIKSLKGPPEKDAVLLVEAGQLIMQGLQKGLESEWDTIAKWLSEVNPADEMDKNIGTQMTDVINSAISDMADQLSGYEEFNPTITPVLDMTQVSKDAKQFSSLIPSGPTITPAYSYNQASAIAASALTAQQDPNNAPTGSGDVKFEQNIYAPTQLSTSDIYKNTRNQITIAKQELSIP